MTIVTTDNKHYTNIANAIREKTGETILMKPEEIPENVPKVYEAGKTDFGRKKSVSGEALHIEDINPNEHSVGVRVESGNLVSSIKSGAHMHGSGYYSSGAANYITCDFILVEEGKTYNIIATYSEEGLQFNPRVHGICQYDANKNFISALHEYETDYTTYTAPLGCKYITINIYFEESYIIVPVDYVKSLRVEKDISSFESINVTVCGKNLIPFPYMDAETNERNGQTFVVSDDGTLTINGTTTEASWYILSKKVYLQKGIKYCMSGLPSYGSWNWYFYVADAGGGYNYSAATNTDSMVFEVDGTGYAEVSMCMVKGYTINNVSFKLQIERADAATDYETYNGTTYTPNADGTIEGVTSLYPMSIFTDTAGVIINADYYQDVENFNEDSEYDRIWNAIQDNGTRRYYYAGFANWIDEAFYPKYDIVPLSSCNMLFQSCRIVDLIQRCKDCGITIDFSQATSTNEIFAYNPVLERVPVVDASSSNSVIYMFCNCNALKEVEKLILPLTTNSEYTKMFQNCYALEEIIVEGAILRDFDIHWSTKLNKESITSIVNVLSDDATGQTLSLSSTAVTNAFGSTTADEWTALVATKQNWTISLV